MLLLLHLHFVHSEGFEYRIRVTLQEHFWALFVQNLTQTINKKRNRKCSPLLASYDDAIKWKHIPRYWPSVRGIHGHRWIPLAKASGAEFWSFRCSALNKQLSKQSRRRWFETPSRSLWRHCNVLGFRRFFAMWKVYPFHDVIVRVLCRPYLSFCEDPQVQRTLAPYCFDPGSKYAHMQGSFSV